MDVTKCLTISTGHVSKETVRFLMKQDGPLAVYPKGKVGFWIYCGDTEDNRGRDIPDDLFQCMMLAKKMTAAGCVSTGTEGSRLSLKCMNGKNGRKNA